jgi:hypothetical protein
MYQEQFTERTVPFRRSHARAERALDRGEEHFAHRSWMISLRVDPHVVRVIETTSRCLQQDNLSQSEEDKKAQDVSRSGDEDRRRRRWVLTELVEDEWNEGTEQSGDDQV